MTEVKHILDTPIEFLKGVGPSRAEALRNELGIHCFRDLLYDFPFRYVDKTSYTFIKDIRSDGETVFLKAKVISMESIKGKKGFRLSGMAHDGTGFIELIWFQKVKLISEMILPEREYSIYGKVKVFKGKKSIVHPEMESIELYTSKTILKYDPVYRSTEKLDTIGLGGKSRRRLTAHLFERITSAAIEDNLPGYIRSKQGLVSKWEALRWIHFPGQEDELKASQQRLKFEELFYNQLVLLQNKAIRKNRIKGIIFEKVGHYFHTFFEKHLPFELTGAQKRVIREIRQDLGSGAQMNRLLQGDVGSGKTMVALMTMILAIDNDHQSCLMAPTEILARQHYESIMNYVQGMGLRVAYLSGSIKGNHRKELLKLLKSGDIHILIGTHALIEDPVVFKKLGLAITDEQHRFGVNQRAKLWQKNPETVPHILVMTATPIPRTLAMTRYGDLDLSIIDELPPGRKEIRTIHRSDQSRPRVYDFLKQQIGLGRQIYIVYPLIEESEVLDLRNLQDGYERLLQIFPRPDFQISIIHGKMKPEAKDYEMKRFAEGRTDIMVATTVIEVGVNVPNATVMLIENSERFGLSQLHQLRGRVGRGGEQSYCILMSGFKLSADAKERIATMVRTNDGFEIAEVDMMLRGPGDITGTRQSGAVEFQLANLVEDQAILKAARLIAKILVEKDPVLEDPTHLPIKNYMGRYKLKYKDWGLIS